MSSHKTKFEDYRAETFLNKYYKTKGIKVDPIGVGEESQAFYFSFGNEDYVLRVSRHGKLEYLKDQIAHNEFSFTKLAIPEVIDIGGIDDKISFIITRRAKGKTLDKLTNEEVEKLGTKIVEVLAEIHKIKAPGEGYGGWGLNRNGPFKTWKAYLRASLDQSGVAEKTFYDANLHENLKKEISGLIEYCPEDRAISHGDFGTPNILSDGKEITAVIDWGDSLYGDPLKDIANLASWSQGAGFRELFKKYYHNHGGVPENFDKRIACYQLLNIYGSLWFYAYSDQEDSYRRCSQAANKLLAELRFS